MDNTMNCDIIEKAICKQVAIYKAIGMLPPIETKDIWAENNYIKQNQNNLKLDEKDNYVTMNEIKKDSMIKDWRDITDPKLRKKAYKKNYRSLNKDKIKEYQNSYYKEKINELKDKHKRYREENKESIKVYKRKQYLLNKNNIKEKGIVYRNLNKDKLKIRRKNYRDFNRDKINQYRKERIKVDIQFKLRCNLRTRLNQLLKTNFKSGSAVKDLGCTIDELKTYLENKFQPGMTWDNWNVDGWHIDHIKPLSSFDLSDRKQMLEACHYTNLQPLWAQDNLAKSDKIL